MRRHLVAMMAAAAVLGLAPVVTAQGLNQCDFDGDGKTDHVIVRGPTPIQWWINQSATGTVKFVNFGLDTDFFLCGDFDLDGKSDVTVWRSGAAGTAGFWVLRSSDGVTHFEPFGQSGDVPEMVGDYNNDDRDDFAVYRDGTAGSPASYFYHRTSAGGVVNIVQWGVDGDIAFTLDFDGDGRKDHAVQRNGGGGAGHIWIRQSSNGATVFRNWGLSSDFVVPGNWSGDARHDLTVSKNQNFGPGTFRYFWTLSTPSTATFSVTQWGIPGDFICQGDWDGDGVTDVGVWRSSATPGASGFWVFGSTAGLQFKQWGHSGDYPVNNYNVH